MIARCDAEPCNRTAIIIAKSVSILLDTLQPRPFWAKFRPTPQSENLKTSEETYVEKSHHSIVCSICIVGWRIVRIRTVDRSRY
jgi:hypothetical protein